MGKSIIREIPDDKFIDIIKSSKNWSDAMRNCGMNNVGNSKTIKKRVNELKLDTSHFNVNNYDKSVFRKLSNEEIFIQNSTTNRSTIKKRLIVDLKWKYECASCEISEWKNRNGETVKISLELEHKNGINNDNRLENLELLCPNCHSVTDTFRGKNKSYPEKKRCVDCNVIVFKTSERCNFCNNKKKIKEAIEKGRPTFEQLKKDLESLSFVKTGEKYKVSDNCIRKWLKGYEKYKLN